MCFEELTCPLLDTVLLSWEYDLLDMKAGAQQQLSRSDSKRRHQHQAEVDLESMVSVSNQVLLMQRTGSGKSSLYTPTSA